MSKPINIKVDDDMIYILLVMYTYIFKWKAKLFIKLYIL